MEPRCRTRPGLVGALVVVGWLVITVGVWAESPDAASHEAVGLRYMTFVTGGASPDEPLPMLIALHSMASSAAGMSSYCHLNDLPAAVRIVLPQSEIPLDGGFTWWPEAEYERPIDAQRTTLAARADQLAAFAAAVMRRHPTVGKPLVFGISQGADLSFLLALRAPETIAGAIAVAPRLPRAWWSDARQGASHTPPIHVLIGTADAIISASETRTLVAALESAGFRASIAVFEGAGHGLSAAMRRHFFATVPEMLVPSKDRAQDEGNPEVPVSPTYEGATRMSQDLQACHANVTKRWCSAF